MLTKEYVFPYIAVGRLLHTCAGLAENARSIIRNGRWTGGFYHVAINPYREIHTLEHSDLIIRPGRPS
jgi:hypothetical protein